MLCLRSRPSSGIARDVGTLKNLLFQVLSTLWGRKKLSPVIPPPPSFESLPPSNGAPPDSSDLVISPASPLKSIQSVVSQDSEPLVSPTSPRVSEPVSDPESRSFLASVTVDILTTPGLAVREPSPSKEEALPVVSPIPVKATEVVTPGNADGKAKLWTGLFKGSENLQRSGEACVRIPTSISEKNKKSWECFILGQFYHEPPSQGTIHNIVNGIWSKQFRDINVSKMEGNAFLFRIPHSATRRRVIKQGLWQIEGQTMFVADWEPGVIPDKPSGLNSEMFLSSSLMRTLLSV